MENGVYIHSCDWNGTYSHSCEWEQVLCVILNYDPESIRLADAIYPFIKVNGWHYQETLQEICLQDFISLVKARLWYFRVCFHGHIF